MNQLRLNILGWITLWSIGLCLIVFTGVNLYGQAPEDTGQPSYLFLRWNEPTTNTDGSPLTDISHYHLDYGIGGYHNHVMIPAPANRAQFNVEGGLYRARIATVNDAGTQSAWAVLEPPEHLVYTAAQACDLSGTHGIPGPGEGSQYAWRLQTTETTGGSITLVGDESLSCDQLGIDIDDLLRGGFLVIAKRSAGQPDYYQRVQLRGDYSNADIVGGDGEINFLELGVMSEQFLRVCPMPDMPILSSAYMCSADVDGNGVVNFLDFARLRPFL